MFRVRLSFPLIDDSSRLGPETMIYNIFYHTRTIAIIDRPEGFELLIYSGRQVSTQEFSVWGANSATAASPYKFTPLYLLLEF
jgi:hypothetical protein